MGEKGWEKGGKASDVLQEQGLIQQWAIYTYITCAFPFAF